MITSKQKMPHSEVKLLIVGSALLDICATCDEALLEDYGLKPDDCIRATALHDPLFEQLFDSKSSLVTAGGSGQNSARIAKWMLGNKGQVAFTGCVGKDAYAEKMKKQLQSEQIRPLYFEEDDVSTGVCACLLPSEGQRSLCTRQGAAAVFAPRHLLTLTRHIEQAHCVYVTGYFIVHSLPVVKMLAEQVAPKQILAMSLAAEYVCREFTKDILDVFPAVDVLSGNEAELKTFVASFRGENACVDTLEAARIVADLPRSSSKKDKRRIVVISRGPDPVILAVQGTGAREFDVPDVKVVDSVGCGDALTGAFLAAYALTGDLDRSVSAGIEAAVRVAQMPGCSPPWDETIHI